MPVRTERTPGIEGVTTSIEVVEPEKGTTHTYMPRTVGGRLEYVEEDGPPSRNGVVFKQGVSVRSKVILNKDHDAILQTLDRAVITDDGRQLFMAAESFEGNVEEWNGVPLIFAQDHPEPEDYDADPEAELARIKGRVVGEVKNASVATDGHKRIMGQLSVDDEEVEQGIADGTISLSTGMYVGMVEDRNGVRTDGPVVPHHVLLFYEDRANLPRDLGTGILNKRKRSRLG